MPEQQVPPGAVRSGVSGRDTEVDRHMDVAIGRLRKAICRFKAHSPVRIGRMRATTSSPGAKGVRPPVPR